jgi:hypothetical protein
MTIKQSTGNQHNDTWNTKSNGVAKQEKNPKKILIAN